MKRNILVFLLIIVLLFSCKSLDKNELGQFVEAPLFGMIYDSESSPVVGAVVVLDDEKSSQTDINGRVLFSAVSRGDHSVVITKENFEEVRMILNFSNRDQVLYSTLISLHDILDNLESSLQTSKMAEAKLFLERALKIDSDDIRFKYLNVVYLSETKEYIEAIEAIGIVKKSYPDDPYIIMTQAKILFYGLSRKTEAFELLKDFAQSNRNEELSSLIEKMDTEINTEKLMEKPTGENND